MRVTLTVSITIAPFFSSLCWRQECGTESGDEVTLVQQPIDREHKICFTTAVSTMHLFPPWMVKRLSSD